MLNMLLIMKMLLMGSIRVPSMEDVCIPSAALVALISILSNSFLPWHLKLMDLTLPVFFIFTING